MQRTAVNSDKILSIGYNAELQVLEIEFADKRVYQFVRVSTEVYASLINAPDKYSYYLAHIMNEFAGQCISV